MKARSFEWQNGFGQTSAITDVGGVAFAPSHVVFRDFDTTVRLAVHNDRVRELRETTNNRCGDETCTDDHGVGKG